MSALVLDLDHTLVHTLDRKMDGYECEESSFGFVHVRPFVADFLRYMRSEKSRFSTMGIWTAGTPAYADAVVKILCDLAWSDAEEPDSLFDFVLTRDQTLTASDGSLYKHMDLVRTISGVHDVILMDDMEMHMQLPGNENSVLVVPKFNASVPEGCRDRFFGDVLHLTKQFASKPCHC